MEQVKFLFGISVVMAVAMTWVNLQIKSARGTNPGIKWLTFVLMWAGVLGVATGFVMAIIEVFV